MTTTLTQMTPASSKETSNQKQAVPETATARITTALRNFAACTRCHPSRDFDAAPLRTGTHPALWNCS